jgi:hypothetical protein
MLLLATGGAEATEVAATSSFRIDVDSVVHVELTPASLGAMGTQRSDLFQQYLSIAPIDIRVYTTTSYEVSYSKTTVVTAQAPGGTTTAFELVRDELLELRLMSLGPVPDDGPDDPKLQAGGAMEWEDVPDTGSKLLFTGGNTEGGALNYHFARVGFRFDLAALRNSASGNSYEFTIRLTIVDSTP